jgi:hypothetical protein
MGSAEETSASKPEFCDQYARAREADHERLVLTPYDRREGMDLAAAAKLAGRSHSTLRGWCERYGIGRRIAGGNWTVSRVALQMLLDGDEKALREYHAGKRSHPIVAPYFERAGLQSLIAQDRQFQQYQRT